MPPAPIESKRAMTITAKSSAEIIDFATAAMPFEKFKELWQRRIVADGKLPTSAMKVAIAD
jgi:hypothetical protein